MKKYIITALALSTLLVGGITFTACDDETEVKSLSMSALLSPTNLTAVVRNEVNIALSWNAMDKAESYDIEVFKEDPEFAGTAIATLNTTESSYVVTGLEGETSYNIRVRSASSSVASSKWSTVTQSTNAEQIFETVPESDLTESSVTLRWPQGETATTITITPGDISYSVTEADIANGYATINGLTPETTYTATLLNGTKTRGTITFTTRIDLNGASLIEEGEDLEARLIAATAGESFVIMSGTFDLGTYEPTQSISLRGYSEDNKPTITGRFKVSQAIESISLSNLIFDGKSATDNLLQIEAGANIATVNIEGCEIRNMTKHIMYNSTTGALGDVTVDNCIIDNIECDGGDGFDFRDKGTLASFTLTETTISNGMRTMLRCQTASTKLVVTNCTFYNICTSNESGNTGLFRASDSSSSLTVSSCLIVNVGKSELTVAGAGAWAKSGNIKGSETATNIYYYNCPKLWTGVHSSDYSSFATEADPGFADAANGDYTVSNQDMIDKKIGDPRWIP